MTTAGAMIGRCLCGAVTLRVTGPHDPRPGACHCRMCQRWSGGLFMCFEVEAEGVTVEGPVNRYASSTFAERAFCPTCGSHLWFRFTDPERPSYQMMPGLFDATKDWPLRYEAYSDRAMTSIRLQGDHEHTTRAEYESRYNFVSGDTL